jgi:ferrochelatase
MRYLKNGRRLEEWAKEGVSDIAVVSPIFAIDCLETLLDCNVEQRERWMRLAGPDAHYVYVPALNADPEHISVLADLLQDEMRGWV